MVGISPQVVSLRAAARVAVCAAALAFTLAATTIPANQVVPDATGSSTNLLLGGPVNAATQPFFETSLGTNGRSCATCHVAQYGYSFTPAYAQAQFNASGGTAALFRKIDGTNCTLMDTNTVTARQAAYSLMLTKGLVHVLASATTPSPAQWRVVSFVDPWGCLSNPVQGFSRYGANVATAGNFSEYRRPLPTADLAFETTILADGSSSSLTAQAISAVQQHLQQPAAPPPAVLAQIVAFESSLYAAQSVDTGTGPLNVAGATGGPAPLETQQFFAGINDPFGGNPQGAPFNPVVLTAYTNWAASQTGTTVGARRAAIAAGQAVFNERMFSITGVAGLNDTLNQPVIVGTCSTCHNAPNAGTHSLPVLMDEGLSDPAPPGLDVSGLPVYSLQCMSGPLAGQTFVTTDIGYAAVSGQCQDMNKMKVFGLRNLAARAPYFHNGSAPGLSDVVNFYNQRFNIGLSVTDQANLVLFLQSL